MVSWYKQGWHKQMKPFKMKWLKAGSRAISWPKEERPTVNECVNTGRDGPAPREWDGPMVGQPRAYSPQRDDLMAEMGWPKRMGWPKDWSEAALGTENEMTWSLAKEDINGKLPEV